MTPRTVTAVRGAVLTTVLLTGCAGDPAADIRALVERVTVEANQRDAAGVRSATAELLSRIDDAVHAGELTEQEAAVLREHALAVLRAADAIDPDVVARREAERAAEEERRRQEEEARRQAEQAEQGDGDKADDKAGKGDKDDEDDPERASRGKRERR